MVLRPRAGRNREGVGILSIVLKEGNNVGWHKSSILVGAGIFSLSYLFLLAVCAKLHAKPLGMRVCFSLVG